MRRSDREITDFQELITVMRGCDVCRLALHDEPYPYILPLNFGLEVDGEEVRPHCQKSECRVRDGPRARAHPRR